MKRLFKCCILVIIISSVSGCFNANPSAGSDNSSAVRSVTISAAVSLKESLLEIKKAYEKKNKDVRISLNFGASGTLQKQIEQGAPVDLFISASGAQIDRLAEQGLLADGMHTTLLTNRLAVVVPVDSTQDITDEADLLEQNIQRIAVGQPESVPAGAYAQAWLIHLKLWDALLSKMIFCRDVTQIIHYVETGEVDAGIVYITDARASKRVLTAFIPQTGSELSIYYKVAVLARSESVDEAVLFYNYLLSEEASGIFSRFGFALPESES